MVKTVLGVSHQGLRDWFIQRVSAVVMAVYTIWFVYYFLSHPNLSFSDWHGLFAHVWMKLLTILFFASLLFHAWVGVWTIFTDYIKIAWLCVSLNVLVFFTLIVCFLWAVQILWGIN
jgi:succinate dehydrogenase / fumarate reductase membrane anchor subunit